MKKRSFMKWILLQTLLLYYLTCENHLNSLNSNFIFKTEIENNLYPPMASLQCFWGSSGIMDHGRSCEHAKVGTKTTNCNFWNCTSQLQNVDTSEISHLIQSYETNEVIKLKLIILFYQHVLFALCRIKWVLCHVKISRCWRKKEMKGYKVSL